LPHHHAGRIEWVNLEHLGALDTSRRYLFHGTALESQIWKVPDQYSWRSESRLDIDCVCPIAAVSVTTDSRDLCARPGGPLLHHIRTSEQHRASQTEVLPISMCRERPCDERQSCAGQGPHANAS
jgi:hypothetical protein